MPTILHSRNSESRRVVRSDLRQLRIVILAAECGSFSAAACRLNMETSAVSRGIRDLETRLGVLLFERTPRGVRPSSAGEGYIHAAKDILERVETADRAAQAAGRGAEGQFSLGCALSFGSRRVFAFTERFSRSHPGIELRAQEQPTADLVQGVQKGNLDAAIVICSRNSEHQGANGLCRMRLWAENVVLTSDRPPSPLKGELTGEVRPVLVRVDPEWTAIAKAVIHEQARSARLLTHEVSAHGLLGLAAAGLGQALVAESELESVAGGTAAWVAVIDSIQVQLEAVWRSQAQSPGLNQFLVLACEFFALASKTTFASELERNPDRSP